MYGIIVIPLMYRVLNLELMWGSKLFDQKVIKFHKE